MFSEWGVGKSLEILSLELPMYLIRRKTIAWFVLILSLEAASCGVIRTTYDVSEETVKATYKLAKFTVKSAYTAGKLIYHVGGFTFEVVSAPLSWPLTREEIETIDGLPPKEAIRQKKVKKAPYVVKGRRYVPMSVAQARTYRETGIASWYGHETYKQKGGHMTANGEAFNPSGLNAAHKYLPLPTFVKVTNLKNRRSIILRVNDRGPFVDGRIIDLSAGAARKLGFYEQGTAKVRVETVSVDG
jgi:rare lipoprotein A